jgi:RimJ/RimL family protein N-acetyltransferase
LRRPEAGEAEACARRFSASRAVAGRPIPEGLAQSFGAFMVEHWRRYGFGFYVLELRDGTGSVGHCGFKYTEASPRGWPEHFAAIELGYSLLSDHRGRGYATEAASVAIAAAFEAFDIASISGRCDVDNPASARVLERCGMFEGATDAQRHFRIARHAGQGTTG